MMPTRLSTSVEQCQSDTEAFIQADGLSDWISHSIQKISDRNATAKYIYQASYQFIAPGESVVASFTSLSRNRNALPIIFCATNTLTATLVKTLM